MKKKFGIFLIALCMCMGVLDTNVTVWAASGKTGVSVSSSSVNIGDTVTVTGNAMGPNGEKVLATMQLSWDANVLQFVNCSVDSNGGGGSRLVNGDKFTITLKAIAAGTCNISLTASDGVLFDTVESLDSMSVSSASVTVNNAASSGGGASTSGDANTGTDANAGNGTNAGANSAGTSGQAELSADNSLKILAISPGTLSPAFSYKTTSYTATVGNDVTNIAVTATPSNEKAVVQSVSGNENLQPGENTIKIVVKAENGVTATYTVKVTKQAGAGTSETTKSDEEETTPDEGQSEDIVNVNGTAYEISEEFGEENIPADFTQNTINYHGKQYNGVSYTKGALNLLWMVPQNSDDENGKFFIYDETRDMVYPFVRMANGEKYVIALLAPVDFVMPETYLQTSLEVAGNNSITAYQKTLQNESEIVSEFYVFYGVNYEGTENWYQYDSLEGTYQRFTESVAEEIGEDDDDQAGDSSGEDALMVQQLNEEKASMRNGIGVLIFVIAVLLVALINLLLARFKKNDDDFFDDDSFDDDLDDDDEIEVTETKKIPSKPSTSKSKGIDVIDFNDF